MAEQWEGLTNWQRKKAELDALRALPASERQGYIGSDLDYYIQSGANAAGVVGDAMGTALDYMIPDALGIGENIDKGIQYLANTETGRGLIQDAQELAQENPVTTRVLGQALGYLDVIPSTKTVKGVTDVISTAFDPRMKGVGAASYDVMVPAWYGADIENTRLSDQSERFFELANKQYEARKNGKPDIDLSGEKLSFVQRQILTGDSKYAKMALEAYGKHAPSAKRSEKSPPQSLGAQFNRTVQGFRDFFANGGSRTINAFFSPEARARFVESGISPSTYNQIVEFQKLDAEIVNLESQGLKVPQGKIVERDQQLKLAQQQALQNAHIFLQAENPQELWPKVLNDIAVASSDPDVLKLNGNRPYIDWKQGDNWYDVAYEALGDQKARLSAEDIDAIQEHIEDVWDIAGNKDTKIMFKHPNSSYSGDHNRDLLFYNPKLRGVGLAFAENKEKTGNYTFKNTEELVKALKAHSEVQNPKTRQMYPQYNEKGEAIKYPWMNKDSWYNVEGKTTKKSTPITPKEQRSKYDVAGKIKDKVTGKVMSVLERPKNTYEVKGVASDGGVWVTSSRVGSAKVEGGVNMLYKIGLDGHLVGVMSDDHGFLEKVPFVGKFIKTRVPTSEVSVTRPMEGSIFETSTGIKTAENPPDLRMREQAIPRDNSGADALARMRNIVNVANNPSQQMIDAQSGMLRGSKQAATGLAIGGMMNPQGNEEQ